MKSEGQSCRRFCSGRILAFSLAAFSGILYFTGFVDFGIWPLAFICFAPLLFALSRTERAKEAFLLSWCMGTSTFMGGYYWLVHLFQAFAEFPLVASFPLYLLFCAIQGLQFAVIGLTVWFVSRRSGISLGWIFPPALAAGESFLPLFFPSYLADSLAFVPSLIQPADIGGVAMISFIAASVSGAVFEAADAVIQKRRIPIEIILASVSLVAFDLGYSAHRMKVIDERDAASKHVRTAIIQGNVGAASKHLDIEEGIDQFRRLTSDLLLERNDIGLIVWPESAFNKIIRGKINLTGHVASSIRVPMIVGLLREELEFGSQTIESRYFNTVAAVAEGGDIVSLYDKVVLVAFGEYLPGEKILSPLYSILPFSSSFTHGRSTAPLTLGAWRISANICYEDILSDHVRTLMAPNVAGLTPQTMVNVTNDSWYGPEEPKIHLALAVFRSVEHRRWLVRATATGISAFIDSSGRIASQSGLDEKAVLIADVPMIDSGPTFFGRFGDWVSWTSLAFLIFSAAALPLISRFRRQNQESESSPRSKRTSASS